MISGKTKVFALFGAPVAHSLSPVMQNGWMADHAIDATYVALPLDPAHADVALSAFGAIGFCGANITVPFKEAAAALADVRVGAADLLGAANVLAKRDGRIEAHNTDVVGFVAALDEAIPAWRGEVSQALIIGAGGAARAIGWGLKSAGVSTLTIANRTLSKAQELAALVGGAAQPWEELRAAFAQADLVVNATSLGLGGNDPDWPIDAASPGAIVADAVYAPLETGLLRAARARGLRAVDGLGMLIHQGAAAFELWFGMPPDTAKARARLLAVLGRA